MFGFSAKVTQRPPSAAQIVKQFNFGTARGLTKTAKEGQAAVQGSVKDFFTYRNNWLQQSNKFGIRTKIAKPNDLTAEIRTNADWLEKQGKGGSIPASRKVRTFHYTYAGTRYIAIPSRALRPAGSTKVIRKALWPSSLRKKKGTFVILSSKSKTPILMTRFAPGKDGYEAMYVLKPVVAVKPKDAFYEPITKLAKKRLMQNISAAIDDALRTMK